MSKVLLWVAAIAAVVVAWQVGRHSPATSTQVSSECPVAGELRDGQGVCQEVKGPWTEYQEPNPFAGMAPVLVTVKQDGTSCPPNYVVKADDLNDCMPAPGTVPVPLQGNGTQQAIEDQTRVLQQMQQEQVNDNLRDARQADERD